MAATALGTGLTTWSSMKGAAKNIENAMHEMQSTMLHKAIVSKQSPDCHAIDIVIVVVTGHGTAIAWQCQDARELPLTCDCHEIVTVHDSMNSAVQDLVLTAAFKKNNPRVCTCGLIMPSFDVSAAHTTLPSRALDVVGVRRPQQIISVAAT